MNSAGRIQWSRQQPRHRRQLAARRIAAYQLERLPVVADAASTQLLGIVSRSDLIKPAHRVFDEEHVREKLFGV